MRIVKTIISCICLLAACGLSWAGPVDSVTVSQVAARFYQMKTQAPMPPSQPVKVYTHYAPSDNSSRGVPVFSVYNVGGGFVMVAEDSRLRPVIAYSTEGPFEVEQIAPSMMDVLDDYAAEIADYLEQPLANATVENPLWREILEMHPQTARNEAVVPPLIQTRWDQNSYYNSLCPADTDGPGGHAYAGCVATAMAQVIRYWEYPAQGTGSHSYSCDYGVLSANFGNTTYNYALMPDRLNSNTPAYQVQEVANLIYQCGVSVDMGYGGDASSAYLSHSVNALYNYFGYGISSYISKSQYSSSAWNNTIKNQLDLLRPVMYRGQSDAGGHAFICDGYDDQDYFHFNWGWSGSNNGYFLLSDLTPGNHNYNNSHGAVVNVFVNRPMMRTSARSQVLYSLNGSADTARIRVISVNGGSQVVASVTGDFTISDGTTSFSDTTVLQSGNHFLYVCFQDTNAASATHHGTVTLTYDSLTTTIQLRGEALTVNHEAPLNPSATSQSSNVHLTWDPPAVVPQNYTYGDDTHTSNYGYSSNYERTFLYRLCDTDLVAFYPALLSHVTFYLKSSVTSCELVVYRGGSYDGYTLSPGVQVLQQPLTLSLLNSNAWNTVALETPVPVVLGEEIWFGVHIQAPGGTYTLPVGSTANYEPEKGEIVGRHYSSGDISWSFFDKGKNFSLRAQFQSLSHIIDHYRITRDSLVRGTTTQLYYDDLVTQSGDYTYHIAAVYADSAAAEVTVSQQVQFLPAFIDTISAQICEGDFYAFYGQEATQSGDYYHYDIDTLTVLQLSVIPSAYLDVYAETCDTFSWNGQTYSVSGDYPMTFVNALGCDSIVTLHLTVLQRPDVVVTASSTDLHYPESAVLTVYGAADSYLWSTGETTEQIEVCPTVPTLYSVTGYMFDSPCVSSDSIWIFTEGVGVADYARPAVCYPNPARDILYVVGAPCDQLLLYDMNGQLCRSWKGRREEWRVPVRHLSSGTYVLVGVADGQRRYVARVVVQH